MTLEEIKSSEGITWDELIERLCQIFASDEVNVEEVEDLLRSYK